MNLLLASNALVANQTLNATVDINDCNNGDPVKVFIIQVVALSCVAHIGDPEMTVAIESFLNAGFRSAGQVKFVVMIGSSSRYKGSPVSEFQEFCS
jgi:hypothetical protein